MACLVSFLFACYLVVTSSTSSNVRPNIIFMLAEDVGFNDVGFTTSNSLTNLATKSQTPFLNKLAVNEGITISSHYTPRMSSASRADFLTGRHTFRYGLETSSLQINSDFSLTRQISLLSDEFKNGGYSTHLIGKWDLGFQSWEYTPILRGFDSFYGVYTDQSDFYINQLNVEDFAQKNDLSENNLEPVEADGASANNMIRYGSKAVEMIEEHAKQVKEAKQSETKPFFMYLAWQSSHDTDDLDASETKEIKEEEDGMSTGRARVQEDTTLLDKSVESVVTALKKQQLWENTILVFCSDNGAQINLGDNYPLRGFKNTFFDGALRVPAFLSGGYLDSSLLGTTFGSNGEFMHVTDWYPTLLAAAGIEPTLNLARSKTFSDPSADLPVWDLHNFNIPLDGLNLWHTLTTPSETSKTSETSKKSDDAVVKRVRNAAHNLANSLDATDANDELYERTVLLDAGSSSSSSSSGNIEIAVRSGRYKYISGMPVGSDSDHTNTLSFNWGVEFANLEAELKDELKLGCSDVEMASKHADEFVRGFDCYESSVGCLFDVVSDPCEMNDLSENVFHREVLKTFLLYRDAVREAACTDVSNAEEDHFNDYEAQKEASTPWEEYGNVWFEKVLYEDFEGIYSFVSEKNDDVDVLRVDAIEIENNKNYNKNNNKKNGVGGHGSDDMWWLLVLGGCVGVFWIVVRVFVVTCGWDTKGVTAAEVGLAGLKGMGWIGTDVVGVAGQVAGLDSDDIDDDDEGTAGGENEAEREMLVDKMGVVSVKYGTCDVAIDRECV